MSRLKIGDRVKSGNGLLGTVAAVTPGYIGVRHDDRKQHLHGLGGSCEYGYGWWYRPSSLTKVSVFKGNIK